LYFGNMSARLDRSLDDIVAETRQSGRRQTARSGGDNGRNRRRQPDSIKSGNNGPIRKRYNNNRVNNRVNNRANDNGPYNRRNGNRGFVRSNRRSNEARMEGLDKWGHEGYEELFGQSKGKHNTSADVARNGDFAYKVRIDSLHYDVLDEDLKELFESVGDVVSAKVDYDRAGRSAGTALVVFGSKAKAEKAIEEFDGRTIDGQPMILTLGGRVLKPRAKVVDPKIRNNVNRDDDKKKDDIPDIKINVTY
jgi:THO complex subunit 4